LAQCSLYQSLGECRNPAITGLPDRDNRKLRRAPTDFERRLGEETDPLDLLRLRMWPISTRVNKPANDDAEILDGILGAG